MLSWLDFVKKEKKRSKSTRKNTLFFNKLPCSVYSFSPTLIILYRKLKKEPMCTYPINFRC